MAKSACPAQPAAISSMNASTLQTFDHLPASANVALPVVIGVAGVSAATVWRYVRRGLLPRPIKIGGATRWNVGALRDALASFQEVE